MHFDRAVERVRKHILLFREDQNAVRFLSSVRHANSEVKQRKDGLVQRWGTPVGDSGDRPRRMEHLRSGCLHPRTKMNKLRALPMCILTGLWRGFVCIFCFSVTTRVH